MLLHPFEHCFCSFFPLVYCDGFNAAWNDWVFRQCRKMMTPFSQVSHLLLVHNVCGSSHATMHRKETKEVAFVLLPKLVLIIHLFFTKMHWQSTDFFTSIAGWHSFFRGFREQSWKTEFFNQVSKSERSELTDFNGFFLSFFRGTMLALSSFLDTFQKIADAASNTKGKKPISRSNWRG